MKNLIISICLISLLSGTGIQTKAQSALTIDKIMKGEDFTGYSPEGAQWSPSGKKLYFSWRTGTDSSRTLYVTDVTKPSPVKATTEERKNLIPAGALSDYTGITRDGSKIVFSRNGDLFLLDKKTEKLNQITSTTGFEGNPEFSADETRINYMSGSNLFSLEIKTGDIKQLTDFRPGEEKQADAEKTDMDKWLYNDQMKLFTTLQDRKNRREQAEKEEKELKPDRPKTIYTGREQVSSVSVTPDWNYIIYLTRQRGGDKNTIMPAYVTESGYTETIPTRAKVGSPGYSSALYVYDIKADTVIKIKTSDLPGANDRPDYRSLYPSDTLRKKDKRKLSIQDVIVSPDRNSRIVTVTSDDRKDLWIALLDVRNGRLKAVDRQHDDAWIAGPGIGWGGTGWLPDNKTIYFQSEESGYSHIFTYDIVTGTKKQVTSGNYEVYDTRLSRDGKYWYFVSNEVDPGINELYRLPVSGGQAVRLTTFNGGVEYSLSPDEKYISLRVSWSDKPWENYILENKAGATPVKVTDSETPEFRSYHWRVPEFIRFKASDGVMVPARLYKPEKQQKNGPAVIFVHGAGYLQNAHRWWSSYFREYMFHNFLVDNGYTVLDIDYRGSAGYGRDWRTAVYRHMGGRDLDDNVDGARYLVENAGVDPGRIGIYGGSYGGFMTLMAMFTRPATFQAGAALRPVTDWAHYSHGWTANVLNTPVADSLAYAQSSPIYFADGLKGALLICHGMMDDNVHFQDAVRLSQRLIELGKENWQLAVYPLESHGFIESSSWTDEYKRIFRLFEDNLKK